MIETQIIGAPSFFPTVWAWIKKWFDPITTSKIFILSDKEVLPTLSSFIDIESIPKKYGGQLDFECGKLPLLDPQVKAALDLHGSEEMFLSAPVRWMDDENGEMMALGVGSVDGHERKERMATLHSLALQTLTRSSTHQGAIPQYKVQNTTATTQSQPVQPGIVNTVQRNERAIQSDSRPQSQHQQVNNVGIQDHQIPEKSQPETPLNGSATAQKAPEHSAQSQSQAPPPQPSAPLSERLNPAYIGPHSDPAKTFTSAVPDGKPTSIQLPTRNGAPPLGRNETVYVTPPSDPSQIPDRFP